MAALTFVLGSPRPVAWSAAAVAALIVWKHRGNVQLILKGTENRLGRKPRES
jgi:glycerol-3-phosphate acyltransferase PlsY